MTIKAGVKLTSTMCDTQVMVLRVPSGDVVVTCGGAPMSTDAGAARTGEAPAGDGTLAGKRYTDANETMEFLCTRGGAGSLAVDGAPLVVKQAKQLPSSD